MDFAAPWDRLVKVTTTLVCVVLIVIILLPPHEWGWIFALKLIVPVLGLGLSWIFAPLGYRIEGNELVVKRCIGPVRIPLSDVKSARPMATRELWTTVRLLGVGGVFGYFGKFYSFALGDENWYATDMNRAVLLETDTAKYVVTPDDRDAFLACVARSR